MFSFFSIASVLLSFAKALIGWLHDRRMIKAGEDAAVARAATELLERTQAGKELRERVNALEPDAEEKLWDRMLKK